MTGLICQTSEIRSNRCCQLALMATSGDNSEATESCSILTSRERIFALRDTTEDSKLIRHYQFTFMAS